MDTALDKEYSPSLWSKRFSKGDDVIASHIDFVSRGLCSTKHIPVFHLPMYLMYILQFVFVESSRVRNTFKYETIFYGTKTNENFDVFGIDLPLGKLLNLSNFLIKNNCYQTHRSSFISMEVIGRK